MTVSLFFKNRWLGGDIYIVATLHRETNNTTHTFFRMGRETVSIKEKKEGPHMVCRLAPFSVLRSPTICDCQ